MSTRLTASDVRSAAAMINLPVSDDEIEPILVRLQTLLDGTDQFAHLIDDTAEIDVRFNANWESELA